MTATQIIPGLSALADRYDVLLCDVWGVIHNGREAFPAACDALTRFRAQGGQVLLVSNAPRPSPAVHPQLDGLGVPRAAWSAVVTSGDATRRLLKARAPGPAWALGPERDAPLYDGLGLDFAPLEGARFIACTGPFDDEVDTPEDYQAWLKERADMAAQSQVPPPMQRPPGEPPPGPSPGTVPPPGAPKPTNEAAPPAGNLPAPAASASPAS